MGKMCMNPGNIRGFRQYMEKLKTPTLAEV